MYIYIDVTNIEILNTFWITKENKEEGSHFVNVQAFQHCGWSHSDASYFGVISVLEIQDFSHKCAVWDILFHFAATDSFFLSLISRRMHKINLNHVGELCTSREK